MKTLLLVIITSLLTANAAAEIYEVVDEHGNKTYTNTPPQGPQKSQPIKIDPVETNVWSGGMKQLEADDDFYNELIKQQGLDDAAKMEKKRLWLEAKNNLKTAKEELEAAKVIRPGDYFPNSGGGIRYTQVYKDRVKAAEQRVEKATARFKEVDKKTPAKDKAADKEQVPGNE